VQRAATPDPAATVSRSSLQESTLREPLDDDPQRTPASLASDHLALVVEGATAMETILGNEELEQRFLKLANVCKAVVACRVSPAQKRLIVGLVRRKDTTRPVTLAIGDGANDVGMIQEAHIGVGISGKEGRQAVNNSDFAIGQFRFLKPLLLKHGRRNYRRMSKVIVYSFFKNIVLTFVLFYYQADCGWSGTSFYEAWVYSGFNFFLAFTPLAFGWFDVDTSAETVRKYPRLYAAGLHRMDLNVTNMAYATLEAVGASLLIYFITRQVYWRPQNVWTHRGKDGDLWVFGTAVFVGMVCLSASATSTAPAHHRQCLRGSLMAWWWRGVLHAIDAPSSLLDAHRSRGDGIDALSRRRGAIAAMACR
jgi:phospholipid-transporting ATPase